jgi:glycyl-tRNA synthetase
MLTFQEIISNLQNFWIKKGCLLQTSYDLETGAGTFNPETFLRALGPEPYNVCHVEISKRPTDGRYGQNPNRLQKFHQFQVLMKPSPENFQRFYLESLESIGLSLKKHDIRFVHDDWESPTQGAWGLGWEVWCDGMEITQFTYFQCIAGVELSPVSVELAYGLERIAMFLQGVSNVYDVQYSKDLKYGDVFLQSEIEFSKYNFEQANIEMWKKHFEDFEKEANSLLENNNPIVAYDYAIRASHAFNILDARGAISTTARVGLMHRVRDLACRSGKEYLKSRESLGFPLLKNVSTPQSIVLSPLPRVEFSPSNRDDFLLEIGSEELPAAFLPGAMSTLDESIKALLDTHELSYEDVRVYGTPRRLSVHVFGIPEGTEDQMVVKKGPPISVAFDAHGLLTPQGKGYLQSAGLPLVSLADIEMGKVPHLSIQEGKYLLTHEAKPGKSTLEILQSTLPDLIKNFPFPKKMRWGSNDLSYARPIRWIVALYGKRVIPFSIANILSSNISFGHSQLASGAFKIRHPRTYLRKLRRWKVIASMEEREEMIVKQLDRMERRLSMKALQRERVLSEVLFLSEYPTLTEYTFDTRFLSLPKELLMSEMIEHQRYFPMSTSDGEITNTFVVTCDRKPTELILKNNKAVLTARLSDGLFLYEQDLRKPLSAYCDYLKSITFHKDLGSVYDKTLRIKTLADTLAKFFEVAPPTSACHLCKADLASAVVDEFPELQGVMGKYYARASGESEDTAIAIEEHWWPISEGSPIPSTLHGKLIALADRLDNLISYMSVGIKPSSSKDPYALRRSAIGIIRILIEGKISLDLEKIVQAPEVLEFIRDKLKGVLRDYDYKKEEIDAVLSFESNDPYDAYARVAALHRFRKSGEEFDKLYQIYKRAKGQIGNERVQSFDIHLLEEAGERKLSECLEAMKPKFDWAIHQKDYLDAFKTLSSLNKPLADFFDTVRVLVDDTKVRNNRIALLQCVFDHTKKLVDFNRI